MKVPALRMHARQAAAMVKALRRASDLLDAAPKFAGKSAALAAVVDAIMRADKLAGDLAAASSATEAAAK